MGTKAAAKAPPKKKIASVQYDMFTSFVSNDVSKVSNTVAFWESIPKYFVTPAQAEKLRSPDGLARSIKRDFEYQGAKFTIKIQPAEIEHGDSSKSMFPGVNEELVEEALKKIFSDQNFGFHDPKSSESWVKFSLSMIERELSQKNKTRNRAQIKQAIQIMSSCVVTIYAEDEEVWTGSILQDLTSVNRQKYLSDTDSLHVARFPLFISSAINSLGYRQFNYARLMSCSSPLTRWLYKKLINRFIQAGPKTTYSIMYTTIQRDSALLQQATPARNRQKVIAALEEMVRQKIIVQFYTDERKKGKTIQDVKYTLIPSESFISEQKAANKRISTHKQIATEQDIR